MKAEAWQNTPVRSSSTLGIPNKTIMENSGHKNVLLLIQSFWGISKKREILPPPARQGWRCILVGVPFPSCCLNALPGEASWQDIFLEQGRDSDGSEARRPLKGPQRVFARRAAANCGERDSERPGSSASSCPLAEAAAACFGVSLQARATRMPMGGGGGAP